MKKMVIVIIFIIIINMPVNFSADIGVGGTSYLHPIIMAIEESKGEVLELNINNTLFLQDTFIKEEDMKEIIFHFLRSFNIEGEIKKEHSNDFQKSFEEVCLKEICSNGIILNIITDIGYNQMYLTVHEETGRIFTFMIYSIDSKNIRESYIIIDIVQNKRYKDIGELNLKCINLLGLYGDMVDSSINVAITYSGKKSREDIHRMFSKISKRLKAETIDIIETERYVSKTLYSELLPSGLTYNNRRVNLQLASRYNEYEGRTYLWIATPLITNTY